MNYYYWKALHMPSGEYLLNHISGSILHTNRIGSKWQDGEELKKLLLRRKSPFKQVKGPQTISFDKKDFELQQYFVTLHKTVRL